MGDPIHSDLARLVHSLEHARALLGSTARRAEELGQADPDHATALRRHLEYAQALSEEAAGCVREAAQWSRDWAGLLAAGTGLPPAA